MTDLELELTRKNEALTIQIQKLEKDLTDMTSLFGRVWLANDRTRTAYNELKHKLLIKEAEWRRLEQAIPNFSEYCNLKDKEAGGGGVSGQVSST